MVMGVKIDDSGHVMECNEGWGVSYTLPDLIQVLTVMRFSQPVGFAHISRLTNTIARSRRFDSMTVLAFSVIVHNMVGPTYRLDLLSLPSSPSPDTSESEASEQRLLNIINAERESFEALVAFTDRKLSLCPFSGTSTMTKGRACRQSFYFSHFSDAEE
ncbi:hypothetical protein BKA93DRAFT_829802 [Sparassis latifolia]